MGKQTHRPPPPLDDSTLVHVADSLYIDTATGMALTRVGYVNALGYEGIFFQGKTTTVHRLVYKAVHGPIPPELSVNHIDANKLNNHPDNLELATQQEQVDHYKRLGLRRPGNGHTGLIKRRRLTDDQIRQVRAAPRGTIGELARELGIARSYAYQIRNGRALTRLSS